MIEKYEIEDNQRVIDLCYMLLDRNNYKIKEIFNELCDILPYDKYYELVNFARGMVIELEGIPCGKAREAYSKEELESFDKKEIEIAKLNVEAIEWFANELIKEVREEYTFDRQKIIELCRPLLEKNNYKIAEIFEELYGLLIDYPNQDLAIFATGMASDFDDIPKGEDRKAYSKEELEKFDQEEEEIAKLNAAGIESFARELIAEMSKAKIRIITREYLISLLDAWKENKITAVDLHETVNSLYPLDANKDVADWEICRGSEESATCIVLGYLDMLDVDFTTQEDIEPCKEFLRTPIGKLDEGYAKWQRYIATIDYAEREQRLRGIPPYTV